MKFYAIATVLCSVATIASASRFVGFSGDYWTGGSKSYGACGCTDLDLGYRSSLKWYGTGQSGRMFDTTNCQGSAQNTLPPGEYREGATGFGWKSIDIIC